MKEKSYYEETTETLLIKNIARGNNRIHLRFDDRNPSEEMGIRWLVHSYFLTAKRGKGLVPLEKDTTLVNYLIEEKFYDFLYELVAAVDKFVKGHESYEVASKVSEMTQQEKLNLTFDLQHLYEKTYSDFLEKIKENPYEDSDVE